MFIESKKKHRNDVTWLSSTLSGIPWRNAFARYQTTLGEWECFFKCFCLLFGKTNSCASEFYLRF